MAQIPIEIRSAPGCMKPCKARSSSPSARPRFLRSVFVRFPSRKRRPGSQLAMRSARGLPSGPCAEARTSPDRLGWRCGTAAAGFVSTVMLQECGLEFAFHARLAGIHGDLWSSSPPEPKLRPAGHRRGRNLQSRPLSSGARRLQLTPKRHSASRSCVFRREFRGRMRKHRSRKMLHQQGAKRLGVQI